MPASAQEGNRVRPCMPTAPLPRNLLSFWLKRQNSQLSLATMCQAVNLNQTIILQVWKSSGRAFAQWQRTCSEHRGLQARLPTSVCPRRLGDLQAETLENHGHLPQTAPRYIIAGNWLNHKAASSVSLIHLHPWLCFCILKMEEMRYQDIPWLQTCLELFQEGQDTNREENCP